MGFYLCIRKGDFELSFPVLYSEKQLCCLRNYRKSKGLVFLQVIEKHI